MYGEHARIPAGRGRMLVDYVGARPVECAPAAVYASCDVDVFGIHEEALDKELRRLNSDYDAKRSHTIFLDPPEITTAPAGLFDRWLKSAGTHKLGGQRKVPRLSNDRRIIDEMLTLV